MSLLERRPVAKMTRPLPCLLLVALLVVVSALAAPKVRHSYIYNNTLLLIGVYPLKPSCHPITLSLSLPPYQTLFYANTTPHLSYRPKQDQIPHQSSLTSALLSSTHATSWYPNPIVKPSQSTNLHSNSNFMSQPHITIYIRGCTCYRLYSYGTDGARLSSQTLKDQC